MKERESTGWRRGNGRLKLVVGGSMLRRNEGRVEWDVAVQETRDQVVCSCSSSYFCTDTSLLSLPLAPPPSFPPSLPPSLPLPCPLQMANVAGSPVFSNKDRYPHFFRALPPEPGIQRAQGVVVKRFGWTEVAYIAQNVHLFSSVRNSNRTHLLLCNVSAVLVF